MTIRQFTTALVSAVAAASSVVVIEPAQAQIYGYSNGWRQPIQSGPVFTPSQSGQSYRQSYPVMQQPNFGQPRRLTPGNFGHSSGNYFGW
jgi:hypothetical protein